MTVTVNALIPLKLAENSQTNQYTAVDCKAIIDKFTGTNVSAGNVVVSVNLCVQGDAESSANLAVSAKSIAPGETYLFPELVGQCVTNGGYISTICNTASALVISASGREVT